MSIKEVKVKGYKKVLHYKDKKSKLNSIISIHNTNRGVISLGGTRMYPYSSDKEMLKDALNLSKKMTYKNALSNLNFGGCKCIIRGDPKKDKTKKLILAMAEFVDSLNGQVYTGQDSGINSEDVDLMSKKTKYLVGRLSKSGDPSIPTALGIYTGIKSAVKEIFGKNSLKGLTIAIQGLGNVGFNLLRYLSKERCNIFVTDLRKERIDLAVKKYKVNPVYKSGDILSIKCDIFSPNVTGSTKSGGALTKKNLLSLYNNRINKSLIIAGGTNIPLKKPELIKEVNKLKNLYLIPSEIINAGGVISVASDITKETKAQVRKRVLKIGPLVTKIIRKSKKERKPLNEIVNKIAYERIYGKI